MTRLILIAVALLTVLLPGRVGRTDPYLEHVEPPSVGRGGRFRLAFVGSELDRALGLWTSLPAGKLSVAAVVSSLPGRTELDVTTTPDCPLGLYGLRLSTEDGLSNLHLFVVDDFSLSARSSLDNPQVEFPVVVAGQLTPGTADRYRLQVQAGQRLAFDVVASRLGNDSDPLVTIFDPRGRRIARHDNSPGLFFDTTFAQTFAEAGVYEVEVRDARYLGSPHWRYLLRIGDFPAARVAIPSSIQPGVATTLQLTECANVRIPVTPAADLPLGPFYQAVKRPEDRASNWIPLVASPWPNVVEREPNDTLDGATPAAELPVHLHGLLERPDDRDHFVFEWKKGDRIAVRAETKTLQSAADVELSILDATGRELQRADDVALPGGALDEALLAFNVGQDGKYFVLVREATRSGGADFTYRIEVSRAEPRFQITAETSAFTIPQDSFQVLPLNIVRTEFNGPIRLVLQAAPPGVTIEPDTVAEGANSVVCRLRASGTAPLGVFRISLLGRGTQGDQNLVFESIVTVQPMLDRQFTNVDLIRHALRDNQRILPPSVRTHLALQITPPSPIGWEPAESSLVLPRYQLAEFPLTVTRSNGFAGPIRFAATSVGQLGEESQGRKQVFYRLPIVTSEQPASVATFHSRSQANEGQERVDLYAIAQFGARRVTLNRSVNLAIKSAVEVEIEPKQLVVAPGGTVKLRITAKRLPSFTGPVIVTPTFPTGIALPPSIDIPAGQAFIEVDLRVAADVKPRRDRIRFVTTAVVSGFQEEPRPVELDLEVKLDAPPAVGK